MNQSNSLFDFREYVPASVLVIDLVSFSKQRADTVSSVLSYLERSFGKVVERLQIDNNDLSFSFTGDGYVLSLFRQASSRMMDFLIAFYPHLQELRDKHSQEFRMGISYGLLSLRYNSLTKKPEHFDDPGILSARLEQSASSGEILCTESVYGIFAIHYPSMFPSKPRKMRTKDRWLKVYNIVPINLQAFHEFIYSYFVVPESNNNDVPEDSRNILLVDDEHFILESLSLLLSSDIPTYRVYIAQDGVQALEILGNVKCCLVVTDLNMPRIDGIELITHVVTKYPDTRIVVISGIPPSDIITDYSNADAIEVYLQKPFSHEFLPSIHWVLSRYRISKSRREFRILHSNPGEFYSILSASAAIYRSILSKAVSHSSLVHSLLRHKAKGLVNTFVTSIYPGNNISKSALSLANQLTCIERLINDLNITSTQDFRRHLESYFVDLRHLHARASFQVGVNDVDDSLFVSLSSVALLIIEELVSNSLDATNQQVSIDIVVSSMRTKKALLIRVADNGPGIPESIRDRVFEEGISTKGIGRGLGLFLIKNAVDLVGGKISYSFDNGSVFQVELRATATSQNDHIQ